MQKLLCVPAWELISKIFDQVKIGLYSSKINFVFFNSCVYSALYNHCSLCILCNYIPYISPSLKEKFIWKKVKISLPMGNEFDRHGLGLDSGVARGGGK